MRYDLSYVDQIAANREDTCWFHMTREHTACICRLLLGWRICGYDDAVKYCHSENSDAATD